MGYLGAVPTGSVVADKRHIALTYEARFVFGGPDGAVSAAKEWIAAQKQGDASIFTVTAAAGVDAGLFAPAILSITVRVSGFMVGKSWAQVLSPIQLGNRGQYQFTLRDARLVASGGLNTDGAAQATQDNTLVERLKNAGRAVGGIAWETALPFIGLGVVALLLVGRAERTRTYRRYVA